MQVKAGLAAADYAYAALEGKMVDFIETSEVTEKKEMIIELRKQISDLQAQLTEHSENHVAVAESTATESISTTDTESDSSSDVKDDEDDDDW